MVRSRKRKAIFYKSLLHELLILALIVILGLSLRLFHLQFYLDNGGLDAMGYTQAGVKYSNGDWLTPSATFKGPFLTLLLALDMRVFGSTFMVAKLVSLIAGTFLPVIAFLLGSELFGKKTGFLSALFVSINPLLIFYHGLVYREILFSLVWTTCIYFALRGFKGNTLYAIIGGVFFAFSSVTIELGIFTGIGFVLYFLYQKFLGSKRTRKVVYKNLDIFFLSAFITLIPFIAKNYYAYKEPFIQWRHLGALIPLIPSAAHTLMSIYLGLMALSIPYVLVFKVFRVRFRRRRRHSMSKSMNRHAKTIKISLVAFSIPVAAFMIVYEIFKGPSPVAKAALGLIKLLEVLAFPESMGFLLILSIFALIYVVRSSNDVALILSALLFSAAGLTWGITTHYGYWVQLRFDEILAYLPYTPLDNAFRYVSSYIPLLTIFASYGILLLAEKSVLKMRGHARISKKKNTKRTRLLRNAIVLILTLIVVFQFIYADLLLVEKAQRDSYTLEKRYGRAVEWLSSQGSPMIYSFNPMLKEQYGQDRVVLLNDESLREVARRASVEKIDFIVSDIFGAYSDAQLALFYGGYYEDQSRVGFNRFQLVKSYKSWPKVQIFKITEVEVNQTALVVQHKDWGQAWISFLSEGYLVDAVSDEDDLTSHFSGDYRLIVLAEIKRILTDVELDILREKVATGVTLIVNGLSPAYMNMDANGFWIGAANFVEAPKDAKWNIRFTESALSISNEIELDKSYALYTSSLYSSPTGLTGIEEEVVVYASRVEDGAVAIYAKPYVDGVVIFSGVRPSYATAAEHYGTYIDFVEGLLEKADDRTLFP